MAGRRVTAVCPCGREETFTLSEEDFAHAPGGLVEIGFYHSDHIFVVSVDKHYSVRRTRTIPVERGRWVPAEAEEPRPGHPTFVVADKVSGVFYARWSGLKPEDALELSANAAMPVRVETGGYSFWAVPRGSLLILLDGSLTREDVMTMAEALPEGLKPDRSLVRLIDAALLSLKRDAPLAMDGFRALAEDLGKDMAIRVERLAVELCKVPVPLKTFLISLGGAVKVRDLLLTCPSALLPSLITAYPILRAGGALRVVEEA